MTVTHGRDTYEDDTAMLETLHAEDGNAVFAYDALRLALRHRQPPPEWCRDFVLRALDQLHQLTYCIDDVDDRDITKALALKDDLRPRPLRRAGNAYRSVWAATRGPLNRKETVNRKELVDGKELVSGSMPPPKQLASQRDDLPYDDIDTRDRIARRAVQRGRAVLATVRARLTNRE